MRILIGVLGVALIGLMLAEFFVTFLLPLAEAEEMQTRLIKLRAKYEPYANALAGALELPLPPWLPPEGATANWRVAALESGRRAASLP
jgi:hypothetical protein